MNRCTWFPAQFIMALTLAVAPALGQENTLLVPEGEAPFSAADLDLLVGPIALYPDDLLGIVLPAATYPLQVVQAARFRSRLDNEPGLEPDSDWDDSVVALLNYPEALTLLNDNLDWTWALGESVLTQQDAVIDAIQDFRQAAYAAGNLASDERQLVVKNDGAIELRPANPEVIYIPYYDPVSVRVAHRRPAYYYYDWGYPLYYYPYPAGFRFTTSLFWGVTTAFSIGWHTHYIQSFAYDHVLHPYYRRTYYRPHFHRYRPYRELSLVGYAWHPEPRRASRPRLRSDIARVNDSRNRYESLRRRDTAAGEQRLRSGTRDRNVGDPRLRNRDAAVTEATRRDAGRTRVQAGTAPAPAVNRERAATAAIDAATSRDRNRTRAAATPAPSRRAAPGERGTHRATGTDQTRTLGRILDDGLSARSADAARPNRPRAETGESRTDRSNTGSRQGSAAAAPIRRSAPKAVTQGLPSLDRARVLAAQTQAHTDAARHSAGRAAGAGSAPAAAAPTPRTAPRQAAERAAQNPPGEPVKTRARPGNFSDEIRGRGR